MGGVAQHELAAAVSEAGGLGTIAGVRVRIAAKIAAARRLTSRPIALNLLLPFRRPGDAEAAGSADAIVTFWGPPRRLAANTRIHQRGSVEEAKAAAAAGADVVIVQGVIFPLRHQAGAESRSGNPPVDSANQQARARWLMLGRQRGAQGVGPHGLRSALFVEHVEFCDREARGLEQFDDWPSEVTAAKEPLLQRVKTVLPEAHSLVRGQPVLEEVQGPTGRRCCWSSFATTWWRSSRTVPTTR